MIYGITPTIPGRRSRQTHTITTFSQTVVRWQINRRTWGGIMVSILSSSGNFKTDGCESFASCMREWTSHVTYKFLRTESHFPLLYLRRRSSGTPIKKPHQKLPCEVVFFVLYQVVRIDLPRFPELLIGNKCEPIAHLTEQGFLSKFSPNL